MPRAWQGAWRIRLEAGAGALGGREEAEETDQKISTDKVDGRSKAVRAYKARVAARSQKTSRKTVTKENSMDGYEGTLDRIYKNLKKSL